MFNQVKIHPDNHRLLWRTNDTEQPRVYRWLKLNFGDKPAPDIAAATIKTPAKASEAHGFPWTYVEKSSRHVYLQVLHYVIVTFRNKGWTRADHHLEIVFLPENEPTHTDQPLEPVESVPEREQGPISTLRRSMRQRRPPPRSRDFLMD